MSLARVRNADRVLVDEVRQSPVDQWILHTRRIILLVILGTILLIALLVAWRLRDRPVTYSDIQDHFKYGSIGSEVGGPLSAPLGGLLPPYWIFKVLPQITPEKLPGGYASLGFIFEPGHDLPVGVSKRKRLGFDQVGLNCAVCHTGTYRPSPGGQRVIVAGMPAHQLDLQRFFDFVTQAVLDQRFTPENVIGRIEAAGERVGPLDRYLYSKQLIPLLRESTLGLRSRIAPLLSDNAAKWGPGRVDTFNPYKAIQFNWNLSALPATELIGASDFPSLWNQKPRAGMHLHWDGNNDSVDERNLSASLGTGATPVTLDHKALARVKDWIWTLPPPKYPFEINEADAAKGEPLYRRLCADCHADDRFRQGVFQDARYIGQVTPIERIGTDPYRLNSYTLAFASNQYSLYPASQYQFTHFRKTYGYANQPLDGVWIRAPYLHNGSVPTLRDLLDAPASRPKAFYRGYDVYDQAKAGFRTDVAEENGRQYFKYDTSLPGNGNAGHDYGTNLSDAEKNWMVEYMKKL